MEGEGGGGGGGGREVEDKQHNSDANKRYVYFFIPFLLFFSLSFLFLFGLQQFIGMPRSLLQTHSHV